MSRKKSNLTLDRVEMGENDDKVFEIMMVVVVVVTVYLRYRNFQESS